MNAIPGYSPPLDRLVDGAAVVRLKGPTGHIEVGEVLEFSPGIGLVQFAPFMTFLQIDDDVSGVGYGIGNGNAFLAAQNAYLGLGYVEAIECQNVNNIVAVTNGYYQDITQLPINVTTAGPGQTIDIEQWIGQDQSTACGITADARFYGPGAVPAPPDTTGSYTLQCIAGVVQWV